MCHPMRPDQLLRMMGFNGNGPTGRRAVMMLFTGALLADEGMILRRPRRPIMGPRRRKRKVVYSASRRTLQHSDVLWVWRKC